MPNEYYHREYNRGMKSIAGIAQLHDKIVIEDKSLRMDEQDELTWEEYNKRQKKVKDQVKQMKKERK